MDLKLIVKLAAFVAVTAAPCAHAANVADSIAGSNEFGYQLLQSVGATELAADPNKNILISPVSASLALQMLLNGSAKNSSTYNEMTTVMGISKLDLTEINQNNLNLMNLVQTGPNPVAPKQTWQKPPPTIMIANSAWGNSANLFRFDSNYVATLKQFYSADAKAIDFSQPNSANAINNWASQNTNGKITSVMDPKTLQTLTFVIMNATYFKASWTKNFMPEATQKAQPFTQGDGRVAKADMMVDRRYGYHEINGNQVMELSYAEDGNDSHGTSMFVVLPPVNKKLADVLADKNGPTSAQFWASVDSSPSDEADLKLPKFKFSYGIKLNSTLNSMGMRAVFSDQADLSALSASPTKVSLVKQDTFIALDEYGTEAAAVTTIGAGVAAVPIPRIYPKMIVDHPFVIAIVDNTTHSTLFLGAVSSITP